MLWNTTTGGCAATACRPNSNPAPPVFDSLLSSRGESRILTLVCSVDIFYALHRKETETCADLPVIALTQNICAALHYLQPQRVQHAVLTVSPALAFHRILCFADFNANTSNDWERHAIRDSWKAGRLRG